MDPVIDERTEDDVAIATNGGFAQSAVRPLMSEKPRSDDHISWSRPMSVHERWNSGLGLRRPAGMGRAWAKMQR